MNLLVSFFYKTAKASNGFGHVIYGPTTDFPPTVMDLEVIIAKIKASTLKTLKEDQLLAVAIINWLQLADDSDSQSTTKATNV